jgi:4-hydroxybenzoyl-CoA thioesterase
MFFQKRYRYRFGDIDHAGIAYYPALFHYFHCCMEDWWQDGLGTSYPSVMRDEHLGLPAVRIEAEFLRPIRYGDEPDVRLGVLRTGTSSVELGFWMVRGDEPAPLCRARITTVAVDMRTMQSRPLPERWRVAIARYALDADEFPAGR